MTTGTGLQAGPNARSPRSGTSRVRCFPTPCASPSNSTPKCASMTNAFRIRCACSSICRRRAPCRRSDRQDAALRRRRRHRASSPDRPASQQHDAHRARCRRRLQLQRLSAVQPVPPGDRLRAGSPGPMLSAAAAPPRQARRKPAPLPSAAAGAVSDADRSQPGGRSDRAAPLARDDAAGGDIHHARRRRTWAAGIRWRGSSG